MTTPKSIGNSVFEIDIVSVGSEILRSFQCGLFVVSFYSSGDIPMSQLLPSPESTDRLKLRMTVIVQRILAMHVRCFADVKTPTHVGHEYSALMSQKSEMVRVTYVNHLWSPICAVNVSDAFLTVQCVIYFTFARQPTA